MKTPRGIELPPAGHNVTVQPAEALVILKHCAREIILWTDLGFVKVPLKKVFELLQNPTALPIPAAGLRLKRSVVYPGSTWFVRAEGATI